MTRGITLILLLTVLSPAWAAISHVATSTPVLSSSSVTSITLTAPAGLTPNDVMIAVLSSNTSSQLNLKTVPAGWTTRLTKLDGESQGVGVYYRVATAADVAGVTTYTWGFDNPARGAGAILAFRGVLTTTPIVASGAVSNSSSASYTAPSITPGVANTMLVALYSVNNGSSSTLSTPAGMTQAFDINTSAGPNGILLGGFYGALAGAGATGTRVTTSGSGTNAVSTGVLLALQPAAASGTANFLVTTSNYGLYCLGQAVTVTARDASNNPDLTYSGTIALSTTTGRGTWTLATGGGTFIDATPDDGLATYTFPGNQSAATFVLSYRAGPAAVTVHAAQLSPTVINDDNTQGAITFSPSGFTVTSAPFSNPAGGVPAFASPKTAGSNFSVYLTAYGQNPTDAVCGIITGYAGAKNLKFWSNYVNPATGTIAPTINGATITTVEGSASAQSVTFTAGQATVTVNYKDAGSLSIAMKDDTTGNPSLPTGIRGSTGTFVSVPANFVVSNIKRTSDNFANPGASSASGAVFITAGQTFTATVTAVESGGATTPNYGRETPAESVAFSATLILPASGNTPAVAGSAGTFTNGVATGAAFSWPEVGIVQLVPHVADSSYLGGGDVVGSATGNVGRFVPNSFSTSRNTPVFGTACSAGSFTYLGQPFVYTVAPVITVTALAFGGATTLNYTGSLMRLTNASLTGRSYTPTPASPALSLTGLPATSGDPTIVDQGAGVSTLTFSAGTGISFVRGSAIAPFAANIALAINVIDLDSVTAANPVTFGAVSGISFSTGANQYYGRMVVNNAVGSELLDLPVSLTTQYYTGTAQGFSTNTADVCTVPPTISFSAYQGSLAAGETCVRDSGSPGTSGAGCAAPAALGIQFRTAPQAGDFNLNLAGPGAGNSGTVTVTASTLSWLRYVWNAGTGVTTNPSALASFGIYPGPKTRIYQREVY